MNQLSSFAIAGFRGPKISAAGSVVAGLPIMRQDVAADPDLGLKTDALSHLGAIVTMGGFPAVCRASALYSGTATSARRS